MRKLSVCLGVVVGLLVFPDGNIEAGIWGHFLQRNLSTIASPERLARVSHYPVPIVVRFSADARPETFRAWLNGKNITDRFEPTGNEMRAWVGPGDGLRVKSVDRGRLLPKINVLKTRVEGPKRKKDVDVRVFAVKAVVDDDPPAISAAADPPPNAAGWNRTDVVVRFSCSDDASGIATCPEPLTVETEGAGQVVSGTATDNAGNRATVSVTLHIDKTPPALTPTVDPLPNSHGWNHSSVTVNFECSDTISGLASCPDPATTDTEGADQRLTGTAADLAGNEATRAVSVSLDMTPPVISVTAPESDGEIFGHTLPYDVEVQGTVYDDLSGIAAVTCNDSAASVAGEQFTLPVPLENGDNRIVAAAVDRAGNVSFAAELALTFYEPEIELAYVKDFEWIWWDHLGDTDGHVTFFKPIVPNGFAPFGSFAQPGLFQVPNGYALAARPLKSGALRPPERFERLWNTSDAYEGHPVTIWKPIPAPGYDCLGLVATYGRLVEPAEDEVVCVRKDVTAKAILGRGVLNDVPVFWQILPDRKNLLPDGEHGVYIGTFDGGWGGFDQADTLDRRYVKGAGMAPGRVEPLVMQYGPTVYHHPFELYYPDDPDHVLDEVSLCWGLFPAALTYDTFSEIGVEGCVHTDGDHLMEDFENTVAQSGHYLDPGPGKTFEYWLHIPTDAVYGNIGRAKSILNVKSTDVLFTDIQFWMFYPFNGPGRMRVAPFMLPFAAGEDVHLTTNGRHFGDWEHVTLRFLNRTEELVGVYMSRHSQGQWFSQNYFGFTLQFSGLHPLVYAAKFSHALYNDVYDHINYQSIVMVPVASIWLWDQTGAGFPFHSFYPGSFEIVASEIPGVATTPNAWLDFEGRWGQNEPLSVVIAPLGIPVHTETEVGRGPTAPATKDDWVFGDPDNDWHWQVQTTISAVGGP